MLYDVYRVGKATSNSNDLLAPETPGGITHVISICFERKGEEVIYTGIDINDYNVSKAETYLFRTGSSRGTNHGPSAILTEVDKTLNIKIKAWFNNSQLKKTNKSQLKLISQIYQLFTDNQKEIENYIKNNMPKGKGVTNLLTVKLDGKFPSDVEEFYQCYSDRIKEKIIGKNNYKETCCLCGKNNADLLPKVDVFKFYTFDKPGSINGGLQKRDIWRNCPVCISCEPILREGKKYMLDNLGFNFYNLNYYLIPSSTCNEDVQEVLLDLLENISNKSFSFKEGAAKEIDSLSDDIFDELAEYSDVNSFRIIFFKKENSAERILLDIKDIFPSRFKELYAAKYKIEGIYNGILDDKFNLNYFREFLSKSDNKMSKNDLDSNFLSLTKNIFTGEKLSLETLLPHYMRNIRYAFLNEDKFHVTTLHAWVGANYLYEIGCIIDYRREDFMDENLMDILRHYSAGLDTDLKKALVLTGVLVKKVLNVQRVELNGATPFTSRLKGLKMRQADVQGLISEAVNKLQEYKKYYKDSQLIVEVISELIFRSDANWKLSIDEINFYIAGGMALSNKIYNGLNEKIKEDKSNENQGEKSNEEGNYNVYYKEK